MGTEFEIRRPEAGELVRAGEVTLEAYVADGFLEPPVDGGYADKLRDTTDRAERAELLVAVSSGEVLGSVTIVRPGTPYAEISREGELEFRMLAVVPAARGRGIGTALTKGVLARAVELGAVRVVMSSFYLMTTAHRLYERLGFTRLPDRDWEPEPGVRLLAYARDV